jgi:hypothetical protein
MPLRGRHPKNFSVDYRVLANECLSLGIFMLSLFFSGADGFVFRSLSEKQNIFMLCVLCASAVRSS